MCLAKVSRTDEGKILLANSTRKFNGKECVVNYSRLLMITIKLNLVQRTSLTTCSLARACDLCNLTVRPWDDNEVTIEIADRRQEETGDTSQN